MEFGYLGFMYKRIHMWWQRCSLKGDLKKYSRVAARCSWPTEPRMDSHLGFWWTPSGFFRGKIDGTNPECRFEMVCKGHPVWCFNQDLGAVPCTLSYTTEQQHFLNSLPLARFFYSRSKNSPHWVDVSPPKIIILFPSTKWPCSPHRPALDSLDLDLKSIQRRRPRYDRW